MVRLFKHGEAVIESCFFCGATFEEPQELGKIVNCPSPEDGGCGNNYKIIMVKETNIVKE